MTSKMPVLSKCLGKVGLRKAELIQFREDLKLRDIWFCNERKRMV